MSNGISGAEFERDLRDSVQITADAAPEASPEPPRHTPLPPAATPSDPVNDDALGVVWLALLGLVIPAPLVIPTLIGYLADAVWVAAVTLGIELAALHLIANPVLRRIKRLGGRWLKLSFVSVLGLAIGFFAATGVLALTVMYLLVDAVL